MIDLETLQASLGTQQPWVERPDGLWLDDPALSVSRMAEAMLATGARLVTITAIPDRVEDGPMEELRLIYHWDIQGRLVSLATRTQGRQIASLAPRCPAASWIEREIHDYFAIEFTGRDGLDPLVLRPGTAPGLFQRNGRRPEEVP